MNWIKRNLSTLILVVIFMAGLCLLLYPSFADYWNSFHQSRAIATYAEKVAELDDKTYERVWNQAVEYNKKLTTRPFNLMLSEQEIREYEQLLNIDGTSVMGYIEIPKIRCALPIYHGTDDTVLQVAVGHIQGTSLPTGGKSTHCVLSGHRGLPSAKIFTDIDRLVAGDTFMIRTLDNTLTYEVDRINIVLPDQVDDLRIEEGKDLCTLVTCTPYGINTHRLLVRGHRIKTTNNIRVVADAQQIAPIFVAPLIAVPILLGLLIWLIVSTRKKKAKR
ncbi:MAG: class C sortase [Lachnospiraceae bacterium]|nr:class C sortase [Lachnospiraceae bacterium]